jgi:hypothetical protein
VIAWDVPKKPEPLPKFLDDRDAAHHRVQRLLADLHVISLRRS